MAVNREMSRLLEDHQAIRAHMKFLADSLNKLAAQPVHVRERIWCYRQGLYDFRDAIAMHVELDEHIFSELRDRNSEVKTEKEHREIRALLEQAVQLASSAIEDERLQEELGSNAQRLQRAFERVYRMIEEHIAREDRMLPLETVKK
jgi:hypothetical protein